jgi:hypothetical protein
MQYAIGDPGGGRMWAVPYTGTKPTPNGIYQGSESMPTGTGVINRYFSVKDGTVKVDSVHMIMCNENRSILFEVIIPVDYSFSP